MSRRGDRRVGRGAGRRARPDGGQAPGPGIWEQVAAAAAVAPDRVAVTAADGRVTFGELVVATSEVADRLADRTTAWGAAAERSVEAGRVVGVLAPTSVSGLVAVLGALRAGVAVAPLEPGAPSARLRMQIERAGVCAVVSVPGTTAAAAMLGVPTMEMDAGGARPARWDTAAGPGSLALPPPAPSQPVPPPASDAIVYVTSGSTGEPKAVVHDHASLLANIEAVAASLEIASDDVAGVVASLAFAASFSASIPYLCRGCPVHVVDPLAGDATALLHALAAAGVTVLSCVPSVHRLLLRGPRPSASSGSLRTVVLGGEALTGDDVALHRRVLGDGVALVNRYSGTETFGIAVHRVGADTEVGPGPLPVGRPVPGREVRLVDVDPATGVGRIEVLAAALGRRYAGDDDRSAEVFGIEPDGRCLVRTGDLGRWRDDGLLEHCGRVDDLVKVNGVRVHLGEVRSAMRALAGVVDAVAVVDGRRLRGLVEVDPAASATLDPAGFRAELAQVLPLAAVPASIVVVDELPRSDRGKVDRSARALVPASPPPVRASPPPAPAAPPAAPLSRVEREITSLWAGLLGIDAVGLDDDLFTLGADSLMAVEVLGVLNDRYQIDLTPRDLLGGATVRELASAAVVRSFPRRPAGAGCISVLPGSGDGDPVLLIPGVAATPLALLPLGRLLAAAGHRVLVADLQPARGQVAARSVGWTACRIVADLGGLARPGGREGCSLGAPLTVVGYSVGCTVAHEVACRLVGTGREVPLLGLLDFAPRPDGALARERRRRIDRAARAVRAGDLRAAAGQAELLLTDPVAPFLLALVDRVPAVADRRSRLTMANGRRAAARHGLGTWTGRTLLGWSAPRPEGRARWGDRLGGPVEEVTVGGDHFSMLARPQVDDLGAALLAALLAALGARGGTRGFPHSRQR